MKIGLIGCGSVVESMHLPVVVRVPNLRILWVCDKSSSRAARVARDWAIPKACSELDDCPAVDAVLIATPVGTRQEILKQTILRGWHALCEKPFATSADLHREFLEQARRAGLILGAGYMRRYFWAVEKARGILRSGMLGSLESITAGESAHLERTGLDYSSYRNDDRASGGGVLLETGCHLIDEMLFIADAVEARIEQCKRRILAGYEMETCASGRVWLASGGQADLRFTVSGVRSVFQGIVVRCQRGELRLSLDPGKGLKLFLESNREASLDLPHPKPAQHLHHILGAIREEWIHFIESAQGDCCWSAEHDTGLLASDVIQQCVTVASAQGIEVDACLA